MRLLRIEESGNFSLVERVGNDIPRYAILSHTWGLDEDEVTFKDMVDGTGKTKAGYSKIQFCGEQAAKDDLRFFWVDTCCIDKSSSAELSEAINSMFQWYHKAEKCYVYLTDVLASGSVGTWELVFRNSRWFTRGWTLQELLAPRSVEFFSVEGERLGDKFSLVKEIHDATGISTQALQGAPLAQFSVDERMSWAERRKTKREEDAAYSLLGIFDVYMALIYGEGQKKAFIRLRKEVEGSLKDQPPVKPPPSLTIPFRRDDDFISRDSLNKVRQICARPAARAALVGLGGVGWVLYLTSVTSTLIICTGSPRLLSNMPTRYETSRQRRGCSGCTQARRRGWRRATGGSPRRREWTAGTTPKQMSCGSSATGCAMILTGGG